VSLFIVYGESMMFLRPVGSAGTVTRVEVGSVGGMPATGKERL
jgi:hypothetical protein